MRELEITDDLTEKTFNKYIDRFTKRIGQPKIVHRISFMILQLKTSLDNRVKITNGKTRLVQKVKGAPDKIGKRMNTSEQSVQ